MIRRAFCLLIAAFISLSLIACSGETVMEHCEIGMRLSSRFEVAELLYAFSAMLLAVTLSLFGLGYIIPLLFALLHSVGAWVLLALGRFNFRNGK